LQNPIPFLISAASLRPCGIVGSNLLLCFRRQKIKFDGEFCPICLEPCAVGFQEVCENGHGIHRECASKMSLHMKLLCPLCRSNLVCSVCKSRKSNIWCNCANMSIKQEHVDESMQQICQTHICAFIAIYFLPINPASLLVVILLNCSLMLRRIVKCHRRSEQIQKWSRNHRNAIRVTQIGMGLTTSCLIAIAAVVAKLYISAFFSSSKSQSPSTVYKG